MAACLDASGAAGPAKVGADEGHGHSQGERALTSNDFRDAPGDLILWGQLAKVGLTRSSGRYHVTFLPPVSALDGKTVTLVGFMTTVHPGTLHTQFLLSDRPILCRDCHSAPDPSGIVEVNIRVAEPATTSPVRVQGKLQLVKDNPNGLIYRLLDARVVRT